ncbi:hypothetical protein C8N35_101144 [Breoghania corrubedonensis]|uniref:Uncharacterized protein n=1 Tax=Breoghania corrubedonensis TaxID=665038 RepID=A0A2T5VEC5_9HYPH|nr:hypothetical protein [Breoghania corrubedonensis]PTW62109.1 hypothetical protein C8N35_101144 [Breoghania corrubedonensis]
MSWSIRDLDNDAREKAAVAAERAGMTVDEWLGSLIRAGSQDLSQETAGRTSREFTAPERRDGERAPLRESSLRERGERLRSSSAPAPASASRAVDKDNISEIASALDRLLAENSRDDAGRSRSTPEPRSRSRTSTAAGRTRDRAPDRSSDRSRDRFGDTGRAATGKSVPGISPEERSHRVERVLAALGKLDERVRSLSSVAPRGEAPGPEPAARETARAPADTPVRTSERVAPRPPSRTLLSGSLVLFGSAPGVVSGSAPGVAPSGRHVPSRYERR